jgi:ferric-dicitrate binding protein FerR (iron transport regulator)
MKDNYKMDNHQERLEAYRKALDEAFRASSDPAMDERTGRMLERLDARIDADAARRRRLWKVTKPLVAVACLLVVAILVWRKYSYADLAGSRQQELAYENTEYQVRRVSLPDGTSVCLQHGATLGYSEKDGMRQAELSGEAYFDVARDSIHPFLVKTAALDLKVLGTAFSVSSIPGGGKTDIILERGSVRLQAKNGSPILRLTPNQRAVYDVSTEDLAVENVSAKPTIQQEYGMVSFENARVDEIIRAIESQYGIKVNASGYNPAKRYHINFFMSDSASEVLAMMEELTGGHFLSSNLL